MNAPKCSAARFTSGGSERAFAEERPGGYGPEIRNAYAMTSYAEAKAELGKISGNWSVSIRARRTAWKKGWRKP